MKARIALAFLLLVGIAAASIPRAAQADGGSPHGKINHIIWIIQENRTPDNLFQNFPGADIQSYGFNSAGQKVKLYQTPLVSYDTGHEHHNWITEYNNGGMNDWDLDAQPSGGCAPNQIPNCRFAYVPYSDVYPYFEMGEGWTFADRMFGLQASSLTAHEYFIRGTSLATNATPQPQGTGSPFPVASPPVSQHLVNSNITQGPGGGICDDPYGTGVNTVDPENLEDQQSVGGGYPAVFPCFEGQTISDLMDAASPPVTWRYYQGLKSYGLWKAMNAIAHINYGPDAANIVSPPTQILNDIASGTLAQMSWVIPKPDYSDHGGNNGSNGTGPAYVAAIVNAVGQSSYWNDCAIIIMWDDWGGWYDHVSPPIYNSQGLGFRVPLIVISPYSKHGYVSHYQHEFSSILRFIEEAYALPSLNTTDVRADDLNDMFNFAGTPAPFGTPVPAPTFTP